MLSGLYESCLDMGDWLCYTLARMRSVQNQIGSFQSCILNVHSGVICSWNVGIVLWGILRQRSVVVKMGSQLVTIKLSVVGTKSTI